MTKKRHVERPYRPAYCSAETLAYMLDLSRTTIDRWAEDGRLPKPIGIGTERRWRWDDIEAWIESQNAAGAGESGGLPSGAGQDPFAQGVARVRAARQATDA